MDVETIWQVPAVAHFVYLFREAYKLPEITYDELEEALLTLTSIANSQEKTNGDLKPIKAVGFGDLNPITNDQVNGVNGHVSSVYNTTYLTNEPKDILIQLICVLLRGCYQNAEINLTNWEYYLIKRFDSTDENQSSPFFEKRVNNDGNIYDHYIAFHEQPIERKAQILYELCEHRLYARERPSKVDELEEDELRVEPIGQDSQGCLYFYFFGTRLYRENPKLTRKVEEKRIKIQRLQKLELRTQVISKRSKLSHKKNNSMNHSANISKIGFSNSLELSLKENDTLIVKPEITVEELREAWCCVCKTEQDWINLTEKFKKSKSGCEKELFTVLNDNFLPSMNQMFLKIQRSHEKKLRFLNQRNSCRLMAKRFQAEEEERQKELEKGNERENRAKRRAA